MHLFPLTPIVLIAPTQSVYRDEKQKDWPIHFLLKRGIADIFEVDTKALQCKDFQNLFLDCLNKAYLRHFYLRDLKAPKEEIMKEELPGPNSRPHGLEPQVFHFTQEDYNQDFSERIPNYILNRKKDFLLFEDYIEREDFKAVAKLCHKILGTARTFGLLKLESIITKLQKEAHKGDLSLIREEFRKLGAYLE